MPNDTAAQRSIDLTQILARPPRVVVADDDWLNRDLLKMYLTEAGCEVYDYADGQAAAVYGQYPPLVKRSRAQGQIWRCWIS